MSGHLRDEPRQDAVDVSDGDGDRVGMLGQPRRRRFGVDEQVLVRTRAAAHIRDARVGHERHNHARRVYCPNLIRFEVDGDVPTGCMARGDHPQRLVEQRGHGECVGDAPHIQLMGQQRAQAADERIVLVQRLSEPLAEVFDPLPRRLAGHRCSFTLS